MMSGLLLLLTSVLIQAASVMTSYYQLQPLALTKNRPTCTLTDKGITYQSQYVAINTVYGSRIRLIFVPVLRLAANTTTAMTTNTTTTTTTTPRPPPAEISPDTFFQHANDLPMQLYSNYICAVYSRPTQANLYRHRLGKRQAQLALDSTQGFEALSRWISPTNQLYDAKNTILSLRQQLLEGFSRNRLDELKPILVDNLNVLDLETVVGFIYGHKTEMAIRAKSAIQMFYVNDPKSSASQLEDGDLKHLLADLIVVVNGHADCPVCDVNFQNEQAIINALSVQLLPAGMSPQQIERAQEAINFLLQANLSADDTSDIFAKFVTSVTQANLTTPHVDNNYVNGAALSSDNQDTEKDSDNTDDDDALNPSEQGSEDESKEDKDDEPPPMPHIWRIMRPRREKRSFYYQPTFDKQIVCFVLNNYMKSSSYCGVRASASQIYHYLQCSVCGSPLQPAASTSTTKTTTTSTPSTTTTAKITTTATTTPTTTTTQRPTTTITTATTTTKQPTTTTLSTTTTPTTTTSTSTTTTTTTTTTQPTTTTATTTTEETTATPAQCGISNIATRSAAVSSSSMFIRPRVVGGRITGTCTTYPWMVKLNINNGQVCGGSILDDRHILTAAHCVINKSRIRATVGEYDTSMVEGTEQVFDVSVTTGVSVHPEFSYFAKTNDVAVLTLDEPIDFDQICASPICLNPNYRITSGQSCTIAGWGATSENSGVASTTLQEASMSTYYGPECSSAFPNSEASYFTDPPKQLCAGQPNVGGVDTCTGDSGGPLMCLDQASSTWIQAGIVSYGEGCARANYPGVYANTASHYEWITQQLKN